MDRIHLAQDMDPRPAGVRTVTNFLFFKRRGVSYSDEDV